MKEKYEQVVNDPDNPVFDINTSGGDVLSISLFSDNGNDVKMIDGSDENVLLYIHGLNDVLDGSRGAILSSDPEINVKKTSAKSVYRITVGDRPVESMPNKADDVLYALKEAVENNNLDPIMEIYEEIIDSQVRRDVVDDLKEMLPNINEDRIDVSTRGWVIDQYYIVSWEANVYVKDDDPDEGDYRITGSGVTKTDQNHEFVELVPDETPEKKQVTLPDGEDVIVGEREVMFLSKVKWLLNRTKYHPDESFWRYTEKLRKKHIRSEN